MDKKFQKDSEIRKLLDQLRPRAEAFMRHVVHQCAKQGYTEIGTVAPDRGADSQSSPIFSDYKRDLEVRESSFEEDSYAICLSQKVARLPMNEPIILTLHSIYRPPALMVQLMGKFQPFTQYTMPFVPDTKVIRVLYRKVGPKDFEKVYRKNLSDWNNILTTLKEANIVPRQKGDIPKIDIYENVVDRIVNQERSLSQWREMVKDFLDGKFLDKILDEKKISRIMNDVSYYQWNKLGTGSEEFSRQDEEMWKKFQEKILGQK